MINSNKPAESDSTLFVPSYIEAYLPDVLIEYLWKLVLCKDWRNYNEQLLILETAKLGGRDVQDIYHVCGNCTASDTHRIFGIKPVDCQLQILGSPDSYEMQFC